MVFVMINTVFNLENRMRSLGVNERRTHYGHLGLQHSDIGRKKKGKSRGKTISEKWLVREKENKIAQQKSYLG